MKGYSTNLIKNRTVRPAARKRIYIGMMSYLLLCAAGLIGVAYLATHRIVQAQNMKRAIASLEQEFRVEHPGESDFIRYHRMLSRQADDLSLNMKTITAFCDERFDAAKILLGLARHLPADMDVVSLDMRNAAKSIELEVAVPTTGRSASIDTSHLTAEWNGDADMAGQLGRMTSVRSQRQMMDGAPVYVLTFSGRLLDK
jgi:hypothetical protein